MSNNDKPSAIRKHFDSFMETCMSIGSLFIALIFITMGAGLSIGPYSIFLLAIGLSITMTTLRFHMTESVTQGVRNGLKEYESQPGEKPDTVGTPIQGSPGRTYPVGSEE